MKQEHLISAIAGGIVAGAAFGAGFYVAQKGIAKISKKKGQESVATTRPMEVVVEDAEMSNMVGASLVADSSWSNGSGAILSMATKAKRGGGYPCVSETGSPYMSSTPCPKTVAR